MTGENVLEVLMAGASSVDVLSAFIYRGWTAARELNAELLTAMRSAESLRLCSP